MPDLMRSKWTVPGLGVVGGLVYLGAEAIGGKPKLGLVMFGVMVVYALGVFFGGRRSETIRGLHGEGRDERFAMLDQRATGFTAWVLSLALLGGFAFEAANGRSGMQYAWPMALGGVGYIGSVIYLRIRS
jgi:hypothetical protein